MNMLHDDFDDDYNDEDTNFYHVILILFFLMGALVLSFWIMQNSINSYYSQTYHKNSPLENIDHPIWLAGAEIGKTFYDARDNLADNIQTYNQNVIDDFNENYAYTPEYKVFLEKKQQEEAIKKQAEEALKNQQMLSSQKQEQLQTLLTVDKSKKVLFAGDSMMQGIAPYMQKSLQNQQIQSINLSKQSTGLAYPKFFDWPATIKKTLMEHSDIQVLMVMLGPNDPWDMPKASGGAYLKFNSPEWNQEYQSRIAQIINFAEEKKVGVIWITPPNMKKSSLNEQMIRLISVMNEELNRHNVKVIDSRPIMGGDSNIYSDYLLQNDKKIKTRSSDGIHFSPQGQQILANEVLSYLTIK